MNRSLASACLLAASALAVFAEDDSRPKEPILPAMPAQAAWTLEFGNSAPPKNPDDSVPDKSDSSLNRITIFKDGTTFHVVSEKNIDGYREAWIVGGMVFLIVPGIDYCALVDSAIFPATDFSSSDFEYFQWLRPADYAGMDKRDGQKVFLFEADSLKRPMSARDRAEIVSVRETLREGNSLLPSTDPAEAKPQNAKQAADAGLLRALGWGPKFRAWLDPATQHPLALESGDLHIRVRYLPAPGLLTVPFSVQRRLEAIRQEQQRLQKRPTRPAR